MAGSVSDDNGAGGSSDAISISQRCPSGDSLSEWRSCEQVENGTPSTSPPYWDTDDDDDFGPKPSNLYGKFTWKIENFSQINKRELRSNAFEVGGYKWYILVYPQGCDVCNHLSLFLCVANHEKLLPGWSHFAQFTIAVVNKDPKKSKYSDTLHRFWKKEHDWGWKKFMELSKVFDGFIVNDMLVIKAQVQVIREKAHRPFRCLDCQYRRELVRVYLTNVEGICRRFVEERRCKLGKLIEDKTRWSSFRAFWLAMDQNSRRRMSREKSDTILKLVVKQFFIEKEVTSTLVMDSLYSGLKALEYQSPNQKTRTKLAEQEDMPPPIVLVEKDLFVLADDVLELLERAVAEPLPPMKDDKGPQNRTKEGISGEDFHKDSIERDERRLTELGRRTVEIFVVTQIYSNRIEVAYQEAVALKRQEELIREEEAAWKAENDLKSKRGTTDKEKRNKKKQAKQKRSNRKKDKIRDEKSGTAVQDKHQPVLEEMTLGEFPAKEQSILGKCDAQEGDVSDVSDTVENTIEAQQDTEYRDASPTNWDTDTSEIHPPEATSSGISTRPFENGKTNKRNGAATDDSSSTCSTESVPSIATNGSYRGHSYSGYGIQTSPSRGKKQLVKENHDQSSSVHDTDSQSLDSGPDISLVCDASSTCGSTGLEPDSVLTLKDRIQWLEQHLVEKQEEVVSLQKKLSVDLERPSNQLSEPADEVSSSPASPVPVMRSPKSSLATGEAGVVSPAIPFPVRQATSSSPSERGISLLTRLPQSIPSTSESETQKPIIAAKTPTDHHENTSMMAKASDANIALLRPSTPPVFAACRPTSSVTSMSHPSSQLVRSVSAAGRLGMCTEQQLPTSTSAAVTYQSYRNAMMNSQKGRSVSGIPSYTTSSYSGVSPAPYSLSLSAASSSLSCSSSSAAALSHIRVSTSLPCPSISTRKTGKSAGTSNCQGFTFGTVAPDILNQPHQPQLLPEESSSLWMNEHSMRDGRNSYFCEPYGRDDLNLELRGLSSVRPAGHADSQDDFPHLDIINYLLDEEYSNGKAATVSDMLKNPRNHIFNRQSTFPSIHSFERGSEMGLMDTSTLRSHFERSMRYADNVLQHDYSSQSGSYDMQREGHGMTLPSYMAHYNGQSERVLCTNQLGELRWPADPSGLSLLRNSEVDGSLFQMPIADYTNLGCSSRLNGYSLYRPADAR